MNNLTLITGVLLMLAALAMLLVLVGVLIDMVRVARTNFARRRRVIELVVKLDEAANFGQFSWDFNQPLAKPIRREIVELIDLLKELR